MLYTRWGALLCLSPATRVCTAFDMCAPHSTSLATLQVAQWLEAPTHPWATLFWQRAALDGFAKGCGGSLQPAPMRRVQTAHPNLAMALWEAHAAVCVAKTTSLPAVLAGLPDSQAATAVAARAYLEPSLDGPTLEVDTDNETVCARVRAALPLLPDLRAVALILHSGSSPATQPPLAAAAALARALPTAGVALTRIVLGGCAPGATQCSELRSVFEAAGPALRKLDLDALGPEPLPAIDFPMMLSATRALEEVTYSASRILVIDAPALGAELAALPDLRTLHLSGNRLGNVGARALAPCLAAAPALRSLALTHNGLSAGALPPLTAALAAGAASRLESLDISCNAFSGQGCDRVGVALAKLPMLTALDLSGCELGVEGAVGLAIAAERLARLRRLALAANALCSAAADSVAHLLGALAALTYLDVSENPLGGAGGSKVGGALTALSRLRCLDVSCSDLGTEGVEAVAEGAMALLQLEELALEGNYGEGEGGMGPELRAQLAALPHMRDLHV